MIVSTYSRRNRRKKQLCISSNMEEVRGVKSVDLKVPVSLFPFVLESQTSFSSLSCRGYVPNFSRKRNKKFCVGLRKVFSFLFIYFKKSLFRMEMMLFSSHSSILQPKHGCDDWSISSQHGPGGYPRAELQAGLGLWWLCRANHTGSECLTLVFYMKRNGILSYLRLNQEGGIYGGRVFLFHAGKPNPNW